MDKLKMQSVDTTEGNIEKIAKLFPNVVTEVKGDGGTLRKAIDFDKLKLLLSAGQEDMLVADDDSERYEFTWVGKRQSIIDAATPIRKTLRPCVEESKNWDTTENLYIEGDNLEVLKLLQESYLGKVKMIYIDPPYNTGHDFIYKDNFAQSKDEYEEELGLFDENDNRLFQNTETNGRFHSDWCSMIYSRLQLARNLLKDDGVIFISIDDNEVKNLKNICDEIFGESNFIAQFVRKNKAGSGHDSAKIAIEFDYVMCYAKKIVENNINQELVDVENDDKYKLEDEFIETRGKYYLRDLDYKGSYSEKLDYKIITPDGAELYSGDVFGKPNTWRWSKEKFEWGLKNSYIVFKNNNDNWKVYIKQYQFVDNNGVLYERKIPYRALIDFSNGQGSLDFNNIMETNAFSYPKSVGLLKHLLRIATNKNSIILDFFSGSATAAHAIMQQNAEDGGYRKFIMVQLPEKCAEDSEAEKAGYKNICEIGKERIRRAGEKILKEQESKEKDIFAEKGNKLDVGFRVFKLDSTNVKDVYYSAGEYKQANLFDMVSNIKDDRTDIDLLYGCLIDWGVPLSLPHKQEKINGQTVHFVNETDLVACFDEQISEETIRTIAKRKPLRVVFRDASFKDSADKINVTEIFKAISPETTIKVI